METIKKQNHNYHQYSKAERNLLLKSEVIKEYPSLLKVLEKYEGMSQKILSKLTIEEKEYLVAEIFIDIYEIAKSEWQAIREGHDLKIVDTKSTSIPCGLCNQPNRLLFYIESKLNDNEINVGSTNEGTVLLLCQVKCDKIEEKRKRERKCQEKQGKRVKQEYTI